MVAQKLSEEQQTSKVALILTIIIFCAAIYQFYEIFSQQIDLIGIQNEQLNELKENIVNIEEETQKQRIQKNALQELLIDMPISVQDCSFFEQVKRTMIETVVGENDTDRVIMEVCNIIK